MAAFLILCRTTQIAPRQFEARVFVVPAGEPDSGIATRSECRIFQGPELAASECARMAEGAKSRLARAGHEVVAIEIRSASRAAVNAAAFPPGAASIQGRV